MTHILHIDTSARDAGSRTRAASAAIVADLRRDAPGATLARRDLAIGEPFINAEWIDAAFSKDDPRSAAQLRALARSDELIRELEAADTIVIGLAMYNFAVPATLKAWLDQVARAGRTFRYTSEGPEGLLKGKRAIVTFASGGTAIGAPNDFATPYLKFMLGFLGIHDVTFAHADDLRLAA